MSEQSDDKTVQCEECGEEVSKESAHMEQTSVEFITGANSEDAKYFCTLSCVSENWGVA